MTPGIGSASTYFGTVRGSSVPPGSGAANDVTAVASMNAVVSSSVVNVIRCRLMVILPQVKKVCLGADQDRPDPFCGAGYCLRIDQTRPCAPTALGDPTPQLIKSRRALRALRAVKHGRGRAPIR